MSNVTQFTDEMGERIVTWIAHGKTLRDFCRQPGTPAWRTVYGWLRDFPDFKKEFLRARDMGFDAIAEEALSIADTPVTGEIETVDGERKIVRKEDMLGHRKLQVETRLKLLAKWDPRRYGDTVKVAGHDGGPLETNNTNVNLVGRITPERAAQDYLAIIKGTKPV